MESWEEEKSKSIYMSHDVHVFYSQIGKSRSGHQPANQIEKVVENSFAARNFNEDLQSSTNMEIVAEKHTRCKVHY